MKRRIILLAAFSITMLKASAQAPLARNYFLPGDTMSTSNFYRNWRLIETSNNDLLFTSLHLLVNGDGSYQRMTLLHRVGPAGVPVWRRKIMVPGPYSWSMAQIRELGDGSIIMVGTLGLYAEKGLFLRFDANGTLLAAHQYGSGPFITDIRDVVAINDSTLLLTGYTYAPNPRPLIALSNNNGDITAAWTVPFPGLGSGTFIRAEPAVGGGFLLTGEGSRVIDASTSLNNVLIARIDSTGSVQWAVRTEELAESALFGFVGAHQLTDGSIRCLWRSELSGSTSIDLVMSSLSALGALQWKKRILFDLSGGVFPSYASVQTSDNEFIVTGGFPDPGLVVIDTSGSVLTAGSIGGDYIGAYDMAHTTDGLIAVLADGYSPTGVGTVPTLIRDHPVPTLCMTSMFSATADTIGLSVDTAGPQVPIVVTTTDAMSLISVVPETPLVHDPCLNTGLLFGSADVGMAIAPNPAQTRVIIHGRDIEKVQLIDATGRVMLSRSFHGEASIDLDISMLAAGPYHMRMLTRDGWCSKALIKE